jgi:hypothetical protein
VRSTTLLFNTLCTSIQNSGENHGQTVAVWMSLCQNAASRRPERRAHPRHGVRSVCAVPPARAPTRAFPRPVSRLPNAPCPRLHPPQGAWEPTPWRGGCRARRAGTTTSAAGRQPLHAQPLSPSVSATWRVSPIKGRTDPTRVHSSRRPPGSATAWHGRRHR